MLRPTDQEPTVIEKMVYDSISPEEGVRNYHGGPGGEVLDGS